MKLQTSRRTIHLLLILAVLLAAFSACREKDVPYVIDEEEIERAALEGDEGRELFRVSNLILPDPYTLPDGTVCIDSVTSHKRAIDVRAWDQEVDYGSYGLVREALLRITDTFYVQTMRVSGVDTSTINAKRLLVRHGFFLKLGDDSRPFVGWVLFGFNGYDRPGTDSTNIRLFSGTNSWLVDQAMYNRRLLSTFDPAYVRLTELPEISDGAVLRVEAKSLAIPVLTPETDSGFYNKVPTPQPNNLYIDTIKTPSNNSTLYNLIYLQPLVDSTGLVARTGILIPYRAK